MGSRNVTPEAKRAWADYMRAWRVKNHERVIQVERERYRRNGDRWRRAHRVQVNARRRELYQGNDNTRVGVIKSSRKGYRRLRDALIAGYGGRCVCCGEREPTFLELDHVNGGGGKHYREHTPIAVYNDLIRAGFPDTFQLLCSNCNRGRQRNGGICPHAENAREEFIA